MVIPYVRAFIDHYWAIINADVFEVDGIDVPIDVDVRVVLIPLVVLLSAETFPVLAGGYQISVDHDVGRCPAPISDKLLGTHQLRKALVTEPIARFGLKKS